MRDGYTDPSCRPGSLDLYVVRKSILSAINAQLPSFRGTLLDVGCGYMPYRHLLLAPPSKVDKYVGLDLEQNRYQQPDITWDGATIPLPDSSVDCAMATEVLEHCPDPGMALSEVIRVLKPGGNLFFTVPFLWPLHDVPHDEYRYTPFALERILSSAGYVEIECHALGGWDASLAQLLGLWATRRFAVNPRKRAVFATVLCPVVWILDKLDTPPREFHESSMITGLWGIARKPLQQ